jgi:hypothetical protein
MSDVSVPCQAQVDNLLHREPKAGSIMRAALASQARRGEIRRFRMGNHGCRERIEEASSGLASQRLSANGAIKLGLRRGPAWHSESRTKLWFRRISRGIADSMAVRKPLEETPGSSLQLGRENE